MIRSTPQRTVPRILFASPCGPYPKARVERDPVDFFYYRNTLGQGLFQLRSFQSWYSLHFLAQNLPVPSVVLENPTMRRVQEEVSAGEYQGVLCAALHADFPMPWVVKPATEGSSIGVHIANGAEEVEEALEKALAYSDRAIVEQYVKGKEIQIGILGQRVLGGVEVRPSREFYNYEAKYTPGLTDYVLPPEISPGAYEMLGRLALEAHNALGCAGATRTDFILAEGDRPCILEVNTIPGMTETSLLPKIARLSGLEFIGLIEEILGSIDAVKR